MQRSVSDNTSNAKSPARTTDFATAPGCLDIARVSEAMVPPADNQSKQHTFSTPLSHHWATLLLRPADVICAAYKYCSMQPGNINLNNLALYRHGGWKAIYYCDCEGKNAYISDVVRVIEASGSRSLRK